NQAPTRDDRAAPSPSLTTVLELSSPHVPTRTRGRHALDRWCNDGRNNERTTDANVRTPTTERARLARARRSARNIGSADGAQFRRALRSVAEPCPRKLPPTTSRAGCARRCAW